MTVAIANNNALGTLALFYRQKFHNTVFTILFLLVGLRACKIFRKEKVERISQQFGCIYPSRLNLIPLRVEIGGVFMISIFY